ETFKGSDAVPARVGDRRDAGTDRLSIEQHGACAALSESAAKSGAIQSKVLLQHVQQRSRRVVNGYAGILPVDTQYECVHRVVLPNSRSKLSESWAHYTWQHMGCQSTEIVAY